MASTAPALFKGYYFNKQMGLVVHTSGQVARLRAKTTKVFCLLAETPNAVVSREQFEEKVWGNSIVTPDSLTQCIFEIRRCLGDTKRKTLVTIPKVGYLLRDDKTINPSVELVFSTDPVLLRFEKPLKSSWSNTFGEDASQQPAAAAMR